MQKKISVMQHHRSERVIENIILPMNFRPSQNSSPKEVREIPTTSHNTGGSGGGRGPGSQNGSCHDIILLKL